MVCHILIDKPNQVHKHNHQYVREELNVCIYFEKEQHSLTCLLSGVPDYFDRNKILSGYDLSHYQVPHCIRVFFYFVWFVFIHHNF